MAFHATVRNEGFTFESLAILLARASEEKSGDELAGLAARSERERVAAKRALAEVPVDRFVGDPLLDPDRDDVTALILKTWDERQFAEIRSHTVGSLRDWLLDDATTGEKIESIAWGITPELAGAAARLMSNKDLVRAAAKIRKVTRCRNTMGERGVFGVRIQPNHPVDDLTGIALATLDGLLYGCGDAVIGVNPATESVSMVRAILEMLERMIEAWGIPTQACCLAHISTQLQALEQGAPIDLLFQSVAGTQAANSSFGLSLAMLREGREAVLEQHRSRSHANWVGEQVMYFETGQGSALSAGAHHGIDQLTLEARAQGVARAFDPFLVNSVVGFIGPEYLANERQITRAGLEDHFTGKLLGLPMGCDVCYTNHADADQNSAENLLLLLALAGCNYVMGVPGSDDVMLNYQSTSYHDAVAVRSMLGLRPAPEFAAWLERWHVTRAGELARDPKGVRGQLLSELKSPSGVKRSLVSVPPDFPGMPDHHSGWLARSRSYTPARLWLGRVGGSYTMETALELRADHAAARDAVLDELDLSRDLGDALVERYQLFEVSTQAQSKREYLLNPERGRKLSSDGEEKLRSCCEPGAHIHFVIGDGLSLAAVRAQVPTLLPLLFAEAAARGWRCGRPFVIRHCRVGILNVLGPLLGADVIVLLIGERPGLATAESLSAYMAYRPQPGQTDADRNLISNIHGRGIVANSAAVRIIDLAEQLIRNRASGVAIKEEVRMGVGADAARPALDP
jgi:ethanolamine ammonia-lyase large subunit